MKNIKWIYLIFILILIFMMSCKKKIAAPVDLGYDYFPQEIGLWVAYEIDSIVYNDFTGTIDTFYYQIKELAESQFIDNQGRLTIRIERYWRKADTSAWQIKDVWFSNRTNSTAEKVEENVCYTKMIFPIKEIITWDGNANNVEDPQDYNYEDIHQPLTINSSYFDSTVTVMQKQELTLISEDLQCEIFAKHIGMIQKKYTHLEKKFESGQWVIDKGVIMEYRMISYGK